MEEDNNDDEDQTSKKMMKSTAVVKGLFLFSKLFRFKMIQSCVLGFI